MDLSDVSTMGELTPQGTEATCRPFTVSPVNLSWKLIRLRVERRPFHCRLYGMNIRARFDV